MLLYYCTFKVKFIIHNPKPPKFLPFISHIAYMKNKGVKMFPHQPWPMNDQQDLTMVFNLRYINVQATLSYKVPTRIILKY